jgi:hypothetical protein
MAKNTKAAFCWIVGILNNHKIPFLIDGGFAARLYGDARALADIDIDIPEDRFSELLPEVSGYVKFGPAQYEDEHWDLFLMTLSYEGQDIDLSGAGEAKIFDQNAKMWVKVNNDFSKASVKEVYGISVPVIPEIELIGEKEKLRRDVDLIDVAQMDRKMRP